jgi:hypothetical protein
MKTKCYCPLGISIFILTFFLNTSTTLSAQTYSTEVKVVCPCQSSNFFNFNAVKRCNDEPFIIAPNCSVHKLPAQALPEGFYFFNKPRKSKAKRNTGAHIIWL